MVLNTVILLVFLLGFGHASIAKEVTCLPKARLNNEVYTSFYPWLEAIKTSAEKGELDDLYKNIDPEVFDPANYKHSFSELNRATVHRMAPSILLDYLVDKINRECEGELDVDLATVSNVQCFIFLGLIELKIRSMYFDSDQVQNNNDSEYKYCDPTLSLIHI